ncbi:MAG: oxidoreductase C-terminal domain-containing protein, partial [Porticoccaceae bacterium]
AKAAAASICGIEKPYAELPWFWSDQYDVKLQIAGMNQGYTHAVIRGDNASHSFTVFYLKGDRIIAVDCINRPKDFMMAKKLILQGTGIDSSANLAMLLADESTELKTLMAE